MKKRVWARRVYDEEGNDVTYLREAITNYWHEHYVVGGMCGLCANRGVLAGLNLRTYCICPNGQAMRYHKVQI